MMMSVQAYVPGWGLTVPRAGLTSSPEAMHRSRFWRRPALALQIMLGKSSLMTWKFSCPSIVSMTPILVGAGFAKLATLLLYR